MTSFMGPMAPPPAAPAQPQALDIRTDPNQRQQFKQFMRQRTATMPMQQQPPMQPLMMQPPMPMMQPPMPMPMGQDIDIFAPQRFEDGGIVSSLNSLQQQAAQFAEQLQSTVMGGGSGGSMGGGGFGGSFNSGDMSGGTIEPQPYGLPGGPISGFEGGGSVPSTLPRSKRDAVAQKVAEMMAIDAERVRAAQQNAEYNRLLRDQDAIDRQVALDRLKADQAASRQDMTLGSILSDIDYEARGLLKRADGGAVPPRNTDIRGQDHMLSYITPDEADILMALGGSGEAGPMGIPAYIGDNEGGQSSSGASEGDVGGPGADDNASDDDMGDADIGGFSGGYGDDVSSDPGSGSDADEVSDALADSRAAEIAGQIADDRAAAAARDRAVRDAFATTTSGKPIGTKSGYLSKESATDEQIAAGYKALGLPDPNSDLASADVEASYGVPVGIASVSGVPTDRLSSNKTGLLGLDPQDLLAMSLAPQNMQVLGTPTKVGMTVQTAYGPMSVPEMNMSIANQTGLSGTNLAAVETALANPQAVETDDLFGLNAPSSIDPVSAPSSNAPGQLSSAEMSALDALAARGFDQNTAQMGLRADDLTSSQVAENVAANIGYDPVTDMPYGLEFATNPSVPGAQITTNLAGLTEQQQKDQPLSMDIAQFIGSKPYGYEIDPKTGQVIGQVGTPPMGILGSLTNLAQNLFMGPPQTTQDLIERGAYTGMTGQGGDGGEGGEGSGQQVKAPTDPCPDGFVMKDGACTPIETGSGFPNQIGGMTPPTNAPAPVIVPSSRFQGYSLQGPVGYGSPIAGQAAPSVASNAAMYQQMLQGGRPPLRFEDGGPVIPRKFEDGGAADEISNFYRVPSGRKIYIGSSQDTVANRQAGSSSLASATQGNSPGIMARDVPYEVAAAANPNFVAAQEALAARQAAAQADPELSGSVVPAPVVDPAPVDPNAYNPIMDVVVPSTRLQDFPASAPPASTQPMPFQGPVGYGSPIAGQGPGNINPLLLGAVNPLYSNALNFQNMLNQPFPLKLQQGGAVSSNLDMAADNFLKALMPAA